MCVYVHVHTVRQVGVTMGFEIIFSQEAKAPLSVSWKTMAPIISSDCHYNLGFALVKL